MKSKNKKKIKSFKELNYLLDKDNLKVFNQDLKKLPELKKEISIEDEDQLFKEMMSDVVPIEQNKVFNLPDKNYQNDFNGVDEDSIVHDHLKDLIDHGKGFIVSYTNEYMEGIGYSVNPEIAKKLHNGDFSIQDYLDLHGFCVEEAKKEFDLFLNNSIACHKRSLLIIHGRGLSSPGPPVLKLKVFDWLSSSPWKKWVIAFTSARPCDGGAGATYVLLRKKPITKKFRRQKNFFCNT